MSYPISKEQIADPFARGQVDMFVKLVEYRNACPEEINDNAIDSLYQIVKGYCQMRTQIAIEVQSGSEVIEVTERD